MPRKLAHAADFRRRLLRWFRRYGRDLPWRRTRDPYHVIVSEFMLQQTQVSRVEAYYHRFLERYPSIESLAAASTGMVRESWDGLGYYRRAANLHQLAQEVVRDHAGVIPSDPVELQRLPGVGRYTAGAVASFAYERSAPAVDTNVARVIRRAFHPRAPAKSLSNRPSGSTVRYNLPTAVSGGLRFTALAAGQSSYCGITTSEAIACWGQGTSGQLGSGHEDSSVPVSVPGL